MEKKNASQQTIMRAIMGAALLYLMASCFSCSDNSFDKVLMKTAQEINKNCPMMIDKETRLDTTLGGPGNRFAYYYTLINFGADDLDTEKFISLMKPRLLNNVKTNKDLEVFRKKNVEIVYVYRSKDKKEIGRIIFSPSDYK